MFVPHLFRTWLALPYLYVAMPWWLWLFAALVFGWLIGKLLRGCRRV